MNYKKVLSIVLGCLLFIETPFSAQAVSLSSVISPKTNIVGEQSVSDKIEPSEGDSPSQESEELLISDTAEQAEVISPSQEPSEELPSSQEPAREEPSSQEAAENGETSIFGQEQQAEDPSVPRNAQEGKNTEECSLNHTAYLLPVGGAVQLQLGSEAPEEAKEAEITWASDREDVAMVAADGTVTAQQEGQAVITATFAISDETGIRTVTASCQITVRKPLALSQASLTLYTGKATTLKAEGVSQEAVVWKSSNPQVATVNAKGKITAQKAGTAQITATIDGLSATCQVEVKKPELELKAKATVYLNSSLTLKATAAPKGKITWKSSNAKIAEVTSKGKIKPKKIGKVTITAACNGVKKQCKVTVKKSSIKLNAQEKILFEENKCKIKASANPVKELEWVSSNTKVAKVDDDGTIVGLKAGKAMITATVPGAKASCEVEVLNNNHKLNHSAQRLMKGKSTVLYLKNISKQDSVSFSLSDKSKGVAKISVSGNQCKVTAKKAGEVTLKASYQVMVDGQWVKGESDCDIEVIDSGIVQQQNSVAVKAKKSLTLKNVEKKDLEIAQTEWVSSDPAVAHISSKGVVTGKKEGKASITATVSYSDGTAVTYDTDVRVSKPRTASKVTVLSLGKAKTIKVEGLNSYSTVAWKVKDSSLASVDNNGVVTAGGTAGTTEVIITADGKKIKEKLVITNPQLKSGEVMLATGKKKKMPITGVSSKSKITYTSKDTSIATVSKSGVIKAKSSGKTKIIAKADGVKLVFQVKVVNKRALSACAKGLKIINSSTYSQARRMSQGYYDCSALVFRAYDCDAGLLGGMPSWAPTAASMAAHLESTGKVISYTGVDASKLLPGDLIFYSNGRNGRYRNIYHVSMYYGDGYRLEKPLRAYNRWGNIAMIARPLK